MRKIKVLNLYAGIGGNRKLWENVDVVAVEKDKEIAKVYKDFFPNDKMIIADAHKYLLKHFKEFDFIWSSPPCPTHSTTNYFLKAKNVIRYPDMSLYQEIIFLKHYFKGKWVVENVIPYYEPLISAQKIQRHLFWANFHIPKNKNISMDNIRKGNVEDLEKKHGFDLSKYKINRFKKRTMLRNCVAPELGKYIFDCAFRLNQKKLKEV